MEDKTIFGCVAMGFVVVFQALAWHYGQDGTISTASVGMLGLIIGTLLGTKIATVK